MGSKVDWKDIMKGYNRIFKTRYSKLEDFILQETKENGIENFAEKVGVDKSTVSRLKRDLRITSKYVSGKSKSQSLIEFAEKNDTGKFSARELSKKFGFKFKHSVYQTLRREKIPYKRIYNLSAD